MSLIEYEPVGVAPIGIEGILSAAGGLGLFLFGMFKMSEGLQQAAGSKLRRILEALTGNVVVAVLVGIVVTAVIQSSSATTVMVVSFVNAGLMTLGQAIGVIMGANIGTTITAQMVAFKLERCALPAIATGLPLMLFGKKKSIKALGDTLLGFGILFLGITIMGESLEPLRSYEPFVNLMITSSRIPIVGVLVGAVFTTLIQSSSATTSLLVTLASRGIIGFQSSVPIILGANIGTTSTALIASVGTSLAARRSALAHLLFNVIGVILFLPFLGFVEPLVARLSPEVPRQVANFHTIFNVTVTLVLLPFVNQFKNLVTRLLKGQEFVIEHGPKYLDPRLAATPWNAVVQLRKEVVRMAKLCLDNFETAVKVFTGDKKQDRRRFDDIETVIDELEEAISYYVAKVSQHSVSEQHSNVLTAMIHISTDLERIGDHATTIMELADYAHEHNLPFSPQAQEELDAMIKEVLKVLNTAIKALETNDRNLASTVASMDDVLDRMEKDLRNQHIRRLNQGICYPASGVVFLDLLSHLERVGDHAVNVAESVMAITQ